MSKLALITGATGGIGSAIAKQLAAQNYRLILHARDPHKLRLLNESLGGNHHLISADIGNPEACAELIASASQYGPISLLVNNAGVSLFANFVSAHANDQQNIQLIQLNLIAPILLCQHFIASLAPAQTATIVNVGSALGSIGFPGFSVYCASKFGLRGFTQSLSREYANTPLRVCYFGPRTTNTAINSSEATNMSHALNSTVDSPDFVASQFMLLLNSNKRSKIVGWPEKFFARINGLLPEVVDRAFHKKTKTIKEFANLATGDIK